MNWTFGDIQVGEARPIHALAVLDIHRTVLEESDFFITLAEEFAGTLDSKDEQIRDLRGSDNSVFLVAKRDRQVLGFLTIQGGMLLRMRHVGKLEVMVAAAARGQGVGKALLTAAIAWAEENEHLEKVGLAVFADNERAIALYRACGFLEEGRRIREYRERSGRYRDDLLMYRMV